MTQTRVAAFLCEASDQIGAGHLVRCSALAQTLRDGGWHTLLLTQPDAHDFLKLAEDAFDTVLDVSRETSGAEIAKGIGDRCDNVVAVVDGYTIAQDFEEELSRYLPVVAFDDAPNRPHAARFLVDPAPGRKAQDYAALVPADCILFMGPQYAILRPPFQSSRAPRAEDDWRRSAGLLVSFGATDPLALIPTTMASLRAALPERTVTVVCSRGTAEALDFAPDPQVRVLADVGAAGLARLMDETALAVGAAGSASWERCVCALPSVVTAVADNQRNIAEGLKAAGAAEVLTLERFGADLAGACVNLIDSGRAYAGMSAAAVQLCDGRGVQRVAAAIERLVAPVKA